MNKKTKKYIKIIVLFITCIIFVYIATNVFGNRIFEWDTSIYNSLMQTRNTELNEFFIKITELGGVIAITLITVISLIFFNKKYKIQILCNVVLITSLNQLLKMIFARPRPEIMRLIKEGGYSFPSGHSMVSTAFYGFFIYLIYKNVKNPYKKWISIVLLSALIFIICISRVYLGVHYASDVIGGFCFSIFYLITFIELIKITEKKYR